MVMDGGVCMITRVRLLHERSTSCFPTYMLVELWICITSPTTLTDSI
jgi:hypothetical protein